MKTTTKNTWYRDLLKTSFLGLLGAAALLTTAQSPFADGAGNADVLTGQACMEDTAGFGLNCTANDVSIADVTNVTILDDGCAFPGDTVNFTADFEVELTAQARHDVGIWFAEDGGNALTGSCTAATPAYAPDLPWLDLDNLCATSGQNAGTCILDPNAACTTDADCQALVLKDTCGDIDDDHNPLFPTLTLTVLCIDTEEPVGDGFLNIPNCTSWRQPGANDLCVSPLDAFPGAPSKCRCDPGGTEVPIAVPGQISSIDKVTLDVNGDPLPGDQTDFDFSLSGPDPDVTPSLDFMLADADTPYMSPGLDAGTYSLIEAAEPGWNLVSAVCVSDVAGQPDQDLVATGGSLDVNGGESLSCTFTNQVSFVAAPSIALDKFINLPADNADGDGSGDVSVGDILTYHFTVSNTGNVTLDPVTVSDPITGPVTCSATSLAPIGETGDSTTCSATYTVQASDVTAGSIENTATATGTPPSGPGDNVTAEDSETVTVPSSVLDITKTNTLFNDADGSGDVSEGDTIRYSYKVDNVGTANLTNVAVSDDQIGAVTLTTGLTDIDGDTAVDDLAAGATATGTKDYVVQAGDLGGDIVNVATASSDQAPDVDDTNTVTVPSSVLDITKTNTLFNDADGSGDVSEGDTIRYSYKVDNVGTANLTNVAVSDDQIGAVTLTTGLTDIDGDTAVDDLAAGATATGTKDYVVQAGDLGGDIVNVATASSDQAPDVDDTNTVTVPSSVLDITKTNTLFNDADGSGDVSEGDTIRYSYKVDNVGTANLTNVAVSDDQIGAVTLTTGLTDIDGDTAVDDLAAGATATGTKDYVVQAGDLGGDIVNVATASSDQAPDVDDTNTVTVPSSVLDITKTNTLFNDADGSGDVSEGDTIRYSYKVDNVGTANLTNVAVSDDQIGAVTLTTGLTDIDGDTAVDDLAAGATATGTKDYVVQAGDLGGDIVNVATASSDQAPDVDDTNTVTVPSSVLDITKTNTLFNDADGSGDVSEGDTIRYSYKVDNVGTANLTNVAVSDDQIGAVTLTTGLTDIDGDTAVDDLAAGATATGTKDYVVQAGDLGGDIVNVATASSDQAPDVDDTNTVTVPSSVLDITKTNTLFNDADGSGDVSEGDTIRYSYKVDNVGTANLTNVAVSDDQIGAVTLTTGLTDIDGDTAVDDLAAGATATGTKDYVVQAGDLGGDIVNVATASSDQAPDVDDTNTVTVPSSVLDITKTNTLFNDADGSGDVSEGDTIRYSYKVDNVGTANLTNVAVSDDQIGAVTLTTGLTDIDGDTAVDDLAAGATATGTKDYVVQAGDLGGDIVNVATASSDQAPDVDDTNTVTVPSSVLDITKTNTLFNDADGSGDVSEGDTIRYSYKVDNVGTANLTNVAVSDDQIGAVTLTTGLTDIDGDTAVDDLAAGATATGTKDYVVQAGDLGGDIVNVATASSDQAPDVDDTNTVTVPSSVLDITKTNTLFNDADGSGDVSEGDTIRYSYKVDNVGTANLTNVAVSDDQIGAVTLTTGLTDIDGDTAVDDLAAGATATGTKDYVVQAGDLGGDIVNVATASSDQAPDVDDTNTVTVPSSVLDITKTNTLFNDADGSGDVSEGDTIRYSYKVDNVGTANLTNVAVSDDQIGAVTLTTGLTDIDGDTAVDDLAAGATATGTKDYVVQAGDLGGDIVNVATASSDQAPDVDDTNTVTVPSSVLDITKTNTLFNDADGSGDVSEGDTIRYSYKVDNVGTANLTNVAVSDDQIGAVTLTTGLTDIDGDTAVDDLAAGATATGTKDYVVQAGDLGGDIVNVATASSDQAPDVDDTNTVTVPSSVLDITKTNTLFNDADGSGDVSEGDTIRYSYKVDNVGTANLTNVAVSDDQIGAVTLTTGLTDIDGDTAVDDLAAGATATGTKDYVVQAGDLGGDIVNVATASSDQAPDVDDTNTVTVPSSVLDITKTNTLFNDADGSGDVSEGDTIRYSYKVDNVGTANLTNVAVSDDQIGAVTLTTGLTDIDGDTAVDDLAAGATATGTKDYVVQAGDLGGDIVNVATASSDQAPDVDDTNTVTVPSSVLDITKTNTLFNDADGSGDVSEGDTIRYSYKVDNVGTANLTNVAVSDDQIGAVTLTTGLTDIDGDTAVDDLAAGATATGTKDYVVQAGDLGGDIVNVATASSDQAPDVDDTNTVTVPSSVLDITKTNTLFNDADGSGDVSEGDTIRYSYKVDNVGTANLTNVAVSDDQIGAVTLTTGLTDIDGDTAVDDLAAGATATGTKDYVVQAGDLGGDIVNVATASSDQAPDVDDTNTVTVPSSVLDITKTNTLFNDADGSGDVSEGDTIRYSYKVDNVGTANLTNVAVSDDQIGAVTLTTGLTDIDGDTAVDDLAAGATATGTKDYVVQAGDLGGDIVNVATASSDQAPDVDDTNTVTVPSSVLDITKTNTLFNDADGSGDVSEGDTIRYSYKVDNVGTANLTNVAVSDDQIGAVTLTTGLTDIDGDTAVDDLAAGATATGTKDYVVQAGDLGGDIVNVATASSDQAPDVDDTNTVTVPSSVLDITKTNTLFNDADGSGDVSEGDTIRYSYKVDNVGTANLTNVAVSDDQIGAVTLTTGLTDIDGDTAVDDLAAGATATGTKDYVVQAGDLGGDIVNVATASSDQAPDVDDTNTVTVPSSVLDITKTNTLFNDADGSGDVSEGDTIRYSYKVDNVGTANLTNVAVSDDQIGAVTLTTGLTDIDGDTAVDDLAAGATATGTKDYVVQAGDLGGDIVNVATASSDQAPDVDDTNTVTVPSSVLDITKTNTLFNDADGSGDVSEGDTIRYSYKVDNVGTANLTNVAVSDDQIGAVTLTTGLTDIDGDTAVDDLAAGATATGTKDYVVQAGDLGGDIVNVATASSDQAPDVDDTNTVTVPSSVLDITKTNTLFNDADGSGDVSEGDTIRYSYKVDNVGTANLTNVAVSDDQIGAVTLTTGLTDIDGDTAVDDLAAGATATGTKDYVVQAGDLGGDIVNVATASSDQAPDVDDTNTVTVPSSVLDITKTNTLFNDADGSGDVSEGDTIRYSYKVDNVGTANLTNVAVSDDQIGAVTLTTGLTDIDGDTAVDDLAAGATATGTKDYVVQAGDLGGDIVNVATASSDQAPDVDDTNTVTVPSSVLDITKTNTLFNDADGSGDVSEGDTIRYSYKVDNVGTANLTNVAVSDDQIGAVTLTTGLTDIDGDTAVDDLAAGATATGTKDYVVQAGDLGGDIVNVATASSDQAPDVDDTNTVTVPSSVLDITKTNTLFNDADGSGDVSEGDTIRYSYKVDNVGTANLTNVAVSDDQIGAVTLTTGLTDIDGDTAVDDLAAGATATGTKDYVVQAGDLGGDIVNVATASSDQAPDVDDTNTVTVPSSVLDITKTNTLFNDADGSGDVSEGDTIRYSYKVDNVGTANLTNVAVSDDQIGAVTLTTGLTDIDGDTAVDDLAAGATATGTKDYVVQAGDLGGDIVNVATASSDQAPDVDDTNTVTVPSSVLDITKTNTLFNDADGSGDVSEGDTIRYSYKVDNVGTANLTNVAVSDDQIGAVTLTTGLTDIDGDTAVDDLAAGATATGTKDYVVQAGDLGGDIVNVATASSDQAPDVDDTNTVTVPSSVLDITKTNTLFNDADGSGDVSEGDTIRYSYKVDNVGTANLTNVAVSDDQIGAVTLTTGLTDIDGDTAVDDLAAGATATGTKDYVVQAGDLGGDIVNVATASSDQAPDVDDTNTVTVPQPSLQVDKQVKSVENPDTTPDADGQVDEPNDKITYDIVVTNNGTANLTNVTVDDNLTGTVDAPCALLLAPTQSCTVTVMYTATQADVDNNGTNPTLNGFIDNTGTGDSVQTAPLSDSEQVPVDQNPSTAIVKTFAADSVIAGGAVSSFTLVVTNTGNVTLSPAVVTDSVDSRLTVTGVTVTIPTAAGGETCDAPNQSVSCSFPTLAVGESATITVDFAAGPGALGDADIGDPVAVEATVPNAATVAAEAPQGDPGNPDDDITNTGNDSIDIHRDINLSIVKDFDPPEIEIPIQPQGTGQVFTIMVSNAGLSDADNVQVTDMVNGFLEIIEVMPGSPTCTVMPTVIDPGTPPPLIASELDCTIDIPAGDSVVITVEYIVAPFMSSETPIYGDPMSDGSEFRFVFDNGSILEGNALGPVYLDGVQIEDGSGGGLTKNDYLFDHDGPGGEDAFLLHLSCSDPFTGGWGQSGGPDEILNPDWQIDYFSIARYKQGGQFFRNCGNVVGLFDVDNTATATGLDWFVDDCPDGECDVVSDDASVTIKEGILMDHYQRKAKHASVDLTNFTGDPKVVRFVELEWPTSNGELRQITLGGLLIWQGNAPGETGSPTTRTVTVGDLYGGDPVPPDYEPTPWFADLVARVLEPVITEKLTFHFTEKAGGNAEYQVRTNFDDGTFLDISIDQDTKGGGGKR